MRKKLLSILLIVTWTAIVVVLATLIIFWLILPKYQMIKSDVTFQELLLALNAAIQTEFDL